MDCQTTEGELARALWEEGYESICSFSPAEAHRLLALCEHFRGVTHWYAGEDINYPPYEYMHDFLTGCSLDDAIKGVSAQYVQYKAAKS